LRSQGWAAAARRLSDQVEANGNASRLGPTTKSRATVAHTTLPTPILFTGSLFGSEITDREAVETETVGLYTLRVYQSGEQYAAGDRQAVVGSWKGCVRDAPAQGR